MIVQSSSQTNGRPAGSLPNDPPSPRRVPLAFSMLGSKFRLEKASHSRGKHYSFKKSYTITEHSTLIHSFARLTQTVIFGENRTRREERCEEKCTFALQRLELSLLKFLERSTEQGKLRRPLNWDSPASESAVKKSLRFTPRSPRFRGCHKGHSIPPKAWRKGRKKVSRDVRHTLASANYANSSCAEYTKLKAEKESKHVHRKKLQRKLRWILRIIDHVKTIYNY